MAVDNANAPANRLNREPIYNICPDVLLNVIYSGFRCINRIENVWKQDMRYTEPIK